MRVIHAHDRQPLAWRSVARSSDLRDMVCGRYLVSPVRLGGHVFRCHRLDQFAGRAEQDPAALAGPFAPRVRGDRLNHLGPDPHATVIFNTASWRTTLNLAVNSRGTPPPNTASAAG